MKLELAKTLLPRCPFMRINACRPDVEVPEALRNEELVLRVGQDPAVLGMPDLVMDAWGWEATISIRGARHSVSIPWAAVYGMWIGEKEDKIEVMIGLRTEPVAALRGQAASATPVRKLPGHLRLL